MSHFQTNINALASSLSLMGLKHIVICPGSRNAPLIMSFARHKDIQCYSATDERSAAFMALGMSIKNGFPAAICCTSGSAVLNLYPAVAEAHYMQVPLLLITADRPPELIDRWDGQAIHQFEVFKPHIKSSLQTPDKLEIDQIKSIFNIGINAFRSAQSGVKGPVHINVPLREPLYRDVHEPFEYQEFSIPSPSSENSLESHHIPFEQIPNSFSRIMVLNGADQTNQAVHQSLAEINQLGCAVVLSDVISGKHAGSSFANWESILLNASDAQKQELLPDLLISTGKMVLNKSLRQLLKTHKPKLHWHISENGYCADTFDSHPTVLKIDALKFINALKAFLSDLNRFDYYKIWERLSLSQYRLSSELIDASFNEFMVVNRVLKSLNHELVNLHLANSMAVRLVAYKAELLSPNWTIYSNRGVSGIDGCTSTALGMALIDSEPHILITGDVAFFYDINAFFTETIPANLKVVLLNNRGGGIFRNIEGPSEMKESERFLYTPHQLDAKDIAQHFGIKYYSANDAQTLEASLLLFNQEKHCSILEVFTDPQINTKIFNQYKQLQL